jgi:hypothetical protein
MMRFAVICLMVLGAGCIDTQDAQAQRVSKVDGNKLLGYCTSKTTTGCDAYLDGLADGLEASHHQTKQACIAKDVTTPQLRDVVVRYIHANPQSREKSAARLTSDAFLAAFPCRS